MKTKITRERGTERYICNEGNEKQRQAEKLLEERVVAIALFISVLELQLFTPGSWSPSGRPLQGEGYGMLWNLGCSVWKNPKPFQKVQCKDDAVWNLPKLALLD